MRHSITLLVNGNCLEVAGERAMMTLSEFLRGDQGLVGTKIVCSEGDCGACSVLIGRASADGRRLRYQSVDSCIVFMYQLDRSHVVTVEGLRSTKDAGLTPVQQAMVDCHGSQCGFCTPGFVVAMHGLCEEAAEANQPVDEDALRLGLSGNLCRCTGYVQIVKAGMSVDASKVALMNQLYPPDSILRHFNSLSDATIQINHDGRTVFVPATVSETVALMASHPDARLVAGATDVGVWYNHGKPSAAISIVTTNVNQLQQVAETETSLTIGSGTTWTRCIDAMAEPFPQMRDILLRFGSPQIRNLGTIGGNIINASPIADSVPFLFAIDAVMNLVGAGGSRQVSIDDFYFGYKQTALRPGELLESLTLPKLKPNQHLKLFKVSRRRDMDISTFTAAMRITIDGDTITDARVALGGVGPVVMRVKAAEQSLLSQPFAPETFAKAGHIAREEISAISDVRGSEAYRQLLAENIFIKCYHELESQATEAAV